MAGGGGSFGISAILEGTRDDDDSDYFKILGCSETSTDEQILAEFKVRALQCHPDKHPDDPKALELFQKLKEAKETLLDAEKRSKYDRWRQSEMCIPYKQWLSMSGRCATTMHWAKPKEQTMIESMTDQKRTQLREQIDKSSPQQTESQQGPFVWRPEKTSSVYSKFRNYKI